jgi:hypothetical protein
VPSAFAALTAQMRSCRGAAVAAGLCAFAACSMPALPEGPSDFRELQIRGTTLLMVGARGKLTAWDPAAGQMREVRASWSAEGEAISIAGDGSVEARRLGAAIVRASAGDLTGTTTVHVVQSVAGRWHGSVTVIDCWQTTKTMPDPCAGRRGLAAPLAIDVTQSAAADNFDNLRAVVELFIPPATGSFIGALESSGHLFLEGYAQRPSDSLGGAVRFHWRLDGDDRLVPFAMSGASDRLEVQLSVRMGFDWVTFNETWQGSVMTR